jgi:hypothetical protein
MRSVYRRGRHWFVGSRTCCLLPRQPETTTGPVGRRAVQEEQVVGGRARVSTAHGDRGIGGALLELGCLVLGFLPSVVLGLGGNRIRI